MATSTPGTAHGTILGTVQYMAPEQVEGKEADARSDIWALGAVIYEMVTGTRPFQGDTPASVIGAILKDDPPPVSRVQPLAPPLLDHIVTRCLAKDPDDRWQSARDMRTAIDWAGETTQARSRRSRLARAMGGHGCRLLAAGGVWLVQGLGSSADRRPLSVQPQSRLRVPSSSTLRMGRRKHHLSRWQKRRVRGGERDARAVDSGPRFAHRPRSFKTPMGPASVLVARQPRDRLFHDSDLRRIDVSGAATVDSRRSTREAARGMRTGRLCSVPTLLARFTRSAPPAGRPPAHRSVGR